MSKKADRTRVSVTLTGPYIEALDRLVEKGLYLDQQAAIRGALRHIFRHHGEELFSPELIEKAEKVQG